MAKILTGTNDIEHSVRPYSNVPTEVCEKIIDTLYSFTVKDTTVNIATLHSCSLVCRNWRVRAQKTLFYKVQLSDGTALSRFSAVLDNGQHLRHYVYEILLTGHYLHTTASMLTSFPAVLAGRLPNLWSIAVVHLISTQNQSHPRPSDPPKLKSLPYIPLHRNFPFLLSTFTSLSHLLLQFTTFNSFSEFTRILQKMPQLEALACNSVRWITPAGYHLAHADFTWPPGLVARKLSFLPKLRELYLSNIAMYAVNRLVFECGPHLTAFGITIPPSDSSEEFSQGGGIDLSLLCLELQSLHIQLTPDFSQNSNSAVLVEDMLTAWKPQHPSRLQFSAYKYHQSTRQGFTDILRTLGPTVDAWITQPSPTNNSKNHDYLNCKVDIRIHESEARRQWWLDCMRQCFPTCVRLKRLHIDFRAPMDKHSRWSNGSSDRSISERKPVIDSNAGARTLSRLPS